MKKVKSTYQEIKVAGRAVVDKVKSLIHQGNIRRIIIKDNRGRTYLEIPLTVATVGTLVAPILAAVGALAALASQFLPLESKRCGARRRNLPPGERRSRSAGPEPGRMPTTQVRWGPQQIPAFPP